MADINTIANQFTDFYYSTFDQDRANLGSLYVSDHCLSSCHLVECYLARRIYVVVGGHPNPGAGSHS